MDEYIQGIKIQVSDESILLEQDIFGDVHCVAIHLVHLRYMAEKLGLVEATDLRAQKTIAMLTRRLHVLFERISHLAERLDHHPDCKNADLSYELAYVRATADVANELCADLPCVSSAMIQSDALQAGSNTAAAPYS